MADNKDNDLHSKIDNLADSQEKSFKKTHDHQTHQRTHGLTNLTMNLLQHNQNRKIDATGKDVKTQTETLDSFYTKQKKHNRGARDARIQILENQDNMMSFMRRGGGPGGGGPGGSGTVVAGPGVASGNTGGSNWQEGPGGWGPGSALSGGISGGGRTSSIVDQTGFVDASKLKKEPVAQTMKGTTYLGRAGEQVDVQGRIINERLVGDRRGAGAALRGLGGKSLEKRLADMDNQYATTEKGMRKLTLGGREMARAEVGKDGKTRYRDERTGEFAREEKFQQSERRKGIFESTLESTAANTQFQRRATGFGIQKQRELMGKQLQKNAGAIQAIVEENPALAAEMKELEVLQEKAEGLRGTEGREARQKVSEQLGRIKAQDKTGQMDSLLDVKGQRKALESGSGLKDMFNIDQDAGFMKGAAQFFGIGGADRLWGDAGTGGLTNLYSQKTKDRLADEKGALGARMDAQQDALETATGKDMLRLTGGDIFEHDARKGENLTPLPETLGQQVAQASEEGKAAAPVKGKATVGAGGKFKSGTDTEGLQQKQLEELVKIREVLERGGFGGGDGGGMGLGMPVAGGATTAAGAAGASRWSRFKGHMGKNMGRYAKAGGVLAVGMGAYQAYSGVSAANEAEDAGTMSAEEAQTERGESIGEGAGGAAGALAGMKLGAMAGAWAGPVGVAVGGAIGGLAGWALGSWAGGSLGGAVGDAIDVSEGELAKSENITNVMMEKIEARDSGLANKIQSRAAEVEQELLGSVADEDMLSDRDKMAIKNAAMATSLKEHDAQIKAIGVDRAKLAEGLEAKSEAGLESAQDSGLYDHDSIGHSDLDKSKLKDATEDQLQAIVEHDDLSDEDMDLVKGRLEEIRSVKPEVEATSGKVIPSTTEGSERSEKINQLSNVKAGPYSFSVAKLGERDPELAQEYQQRKHDLVNERISAEMKKNPLQNSTVVSQKVRLFADQDLQGQMLNEGKLLDSDFVGSGTIDGETVSAGEALMRMSTLQKELGRRTVPGVDEKDMVKPASGAALDYMGDGVMGAGAAAAGNVINNITNNNGSTTPPENVLINPGTVRTSDSTIQRYQDMRYTG